MRVRPMCEIPRSNALGMTSLFMVGVVGERGVTATGRRAGTGTVREKGSKEVSAFAGGAGVSLT